MDIEKKDTEVSAVPCPEEVSEFIPAPPPIEEECPEEIPAPPPAEEKPEESIPASAPAEEECPEDIPMAPPVEDADTDDEIPVPPPPPKKKVSGRKINLKPVIASAAGVAVLGVGGMVTYDIVTALPNPLEPLIDEGFIDTSETDKLGDLIYRCYDGYLDKDINIGDFPIIGELLMHAKTKGYKIPVTVLEGLVAAGAKPDMAVQVGMAERSVWTLAVELGDLEVMKTLARLGTPTESKYVLQAVEKSNEDLLRTFAEAGMDLNYRPNESENTPLMEAVISGKEAMVRLLIELKADLNLRKKTGSNSYASCVDIADSMGNESMLSLLLKAGAIPTGSVAERMVYDACESNSMEMLSTLIETGVDVMSYVEKPPYDRDHLCAIAIRNDNAEMLRFFLLMGVSPNTSVGTYGPMLCMASKLGKKNCVQMLLDGGAEPLLQNKSNSHSINFAQSTDNIEIEKLLLAALNPALRIGYHRELNEKCWDRSAAKSVVEKGNAIYSGKMKPTEYNLVVDVIILFEKYGVALPYEDIEEILELEGQKDGFVLLGNVTYTLAGWAARKGDVRFLEVLKRAGVDMNAAGTKDGKSLIAIAAGTKSEPTLRKLVELGCDVNAADKTGQTPLCYATDAECIRMLTNAGANINATFGNKQQTALMMAAAGKNADQVQLLLEAGANPKLANSEGQTSSALAQAAGAQALANRLLAAETAESNPAEAFRNAGAVAATPSVSTEQPAVPVVSGGTLTKEFVNSIVEKRLTLLTYNSPSPEAFRAVFADEVKEIKSGKKVECDTLVTKAEQIAGEWPIRRLKIIAVGTSGLNVEICYAMEYAKHSGQEVSAYNKTLLQVNNEGKVVGMQETLSTGKRPSLSSKFKKFNYKGTKNFSSDN